MTSVKKSRLSWLSKLMILLVVMFVVVQLYVLTAIGTKGDNVSQLQQQQSRIKIENEDLRAKVLKLQSRQAIKTTVESLQMNPVSVNYIDITSISTATGY